MFIVIAIIAFGILVGIHEFGHFAAAKSLGVKVNEFSIGMGPAVWKKQKGETLYALRCLPIGGYCAMEGEDEETDDPRCFTKQPAWKRIIILCAGSLMNFLLGLALVLVIFAQAAGFNSTIIASFAENSPYEGPDGLQVGDEFYSVDGHRTYFSGNVTLYLSRSASEEHDIVVIRDGEKVELENFRFVPWEQPDGSMKYGFTNKVVPASFGNVIKYSWYTAIDFVRQVWLALSDLVSGLLGLDDLAGVVGIVDMINDVGSETAENEGWGVALMDVGYLVAFIAVNLAVMNMLPIPALDGGRVFFVLLNGVVALVSRRRIPARYEGYVHAAGMVLMLGFMAVIMYNDIARLIS